MAREKSSSRGALVMKFGGTSVGSTEAMTRAIQIVCHSKAQWRSVIVVTSALTGVTDLLLDSAEKAARGSVRGLSTAEKTLRTAHFAIADALINDPSKLAEVRKEISAVISSFITLCQAIAVLGEATPRALDAVASLGERMSVRLLSAAITASGFPSEYVEATETYHHKQPFPKCQSRFFGHHAAHA